ncbi:kinase-like domain-containing protein [Hysterangium stoloniferum]|nr:kinase-like domain-containing protein [Hysterangium stoloniferum]
MPPPRFLWWIWKFIPQTLRLAIYRLLIKKKKGLPTDGGFTVFGPGICAKYGPRVRKSEALAMAFVEANTTIPVPKVLDVIEYDGGGIIVMTLVPGEPCQSSLGEWSESELDAMKETLQDWVSQLRRLPVPTNAVCGFPGVSDPCRSYRIFVDGTYGPFASVGDFHEFLCTLVLADERDRVREFVKASHTRSHTIYFTHGDLSPHNLLISGNKLVGLVDFETAGWYPEYYEFTMAVYRRQRYHEWFSVFKGVFPQYEIEWEVEMALWAVSNPW